MAPKSRMTLLGEYDAKAAETPAMDKLKQLFDEGTFHALDAFVMSHGEASGVVTGYGAMDGAMVCAFVQDGGAITAAHCAKIKKVYELAKTTGVPVVGVYDAAGVKVDEGNAVLSAYGEILGLANSISGVVPQIALVSGVCAGVSAMMATSADVLIMTKDAELFVTPPFTAAAKGEGADGAGSAENAAKGGVAAVVCDGFEAAASTAAKIISILPANNLSTPGLFDAAEPADAAAALQAACESGEVDMNAVLSGTLDADSFTELYSGFGGCVRTGFATLGGVAVGVVASADKFMCPDGTDKAARFVRLCDSFSIPVITFYDAYGFRPSSKDELAGSIRDSAKLAHVYADATCAKVSVIVGSAVGAAFLAVNAADVTLAWPNAVISALCPDAAVALSGKDSEPEHAALVEEYKLGAASAFKAAEDGIVDAVIDPASTRANLIAALDMLSSKRVQNSPKKHGNLPL